MIKHILHPNHQLLSSLIILNSSSSSSNTHTTSGSHTLQYSELRQFIDCCGLFFVHFVNFTQWKINVQIWYQLLLFKLVHSVAILIFIPPVPFLKNSLYFCNVSSPPHPCVFSAPVSAPLPFHRLSPQFIPLGNFTN